jgi:hypothetical protein
MGGTDKESKQFATSVSAPLEYLKPGKLTGVEETANYAAVIACPNNEIYW